MTRTNKGMTLLILLTVLLFSRFYNINYTPRFTQDESSDLARMHSYWENHKITLVGPISNDNIKVFGSLTYYMQLPFAAAWSFEPVGPAIGTAFWGVITVLLLIYYYFQVNRDTKQKAQAILCIALFITWTPLLVTSRWAWNPHLVPFWLILGLVIWSTKLPWRYLFTGLFFGLTLHHHYIALCSVVTFIILDSVRLLKNKHYLPIVQYVIGFLIAIVPFIIFDLRHPPGLFFNAYLRGNTANIEGITLTNILPKLLRNGSVAINEIVGWLPLQIVWLVGAMIVLVYDWSKHKQYYIFALPVLAQIIAPVIVDGYSQRYFLPASIFLLAWLIAKRTGRAHQVILVMIAVMLFSSLWNPPRALTKPIASPPLTVVTQAERQIVSIMKDHPEIKNANIATLTGSDLDSLALKYRDLLSIRDIHFRAASEYDVSENLLVITTEDEYNVLHDQNVAMQIFSKGKLQDHWHLDEKPWQVYWFSY